MPSLAARFYFGTLVSSVGSMTLTVCTIAFMVTGGFSLLQVGLLVGLGRILPIFVNLLFGDLADRYDSRKVIILSEIGGAVGSAAVFWAWNLGTAAYLPFLISFLFRSSILAVQVGARSRMAKTLSDASFHSNSRNAIWLNKVSQGATLFAGVLGWGFIEYSNLNWVILFDAITFIINGWLLWTLPVETSSQSGADFSPLQKFRLLYRFVPSLAIQDLWLAVTMAGNATFSARLADKNQQWTALFLASYGIAVWATGFLERWKPIQSFYTAFWFLLSVSYVLLGYSAGLGAVTWICALFRDTCYWVIFHRISSHVQHATPVDNMAGVASARMVQMVAIIAAGELAVGAWNHILPVQWDGVWRGVVAFGVALYLTKKSYAKA